MIFWVFQILIDLALVCTALGWILSRKRLAELEIEFRLLERKILPKEPMALLPPAPVELSQKNISTNLQERKTQPEASAQRTTPQALEAFDRASILITRGVDLREISKQTGLSIAELQLIGKVSHRTQ